MNTSRWLLGPLLAGALVVSGCGDDDPVGEPVPAPADTTPTDTTATDSAPPPTAPGDADDDRGDDSIDGEWVLRRGSLDGEEIELVEGWDVTLNIAGDQIGGTAACNQYGGTVSVGDESELGGSFEVGELSRTEMACEPAVMELEQRFLAALGEIDSYELDDTLSLGRTGVGTSLMFERVEPVDDTELVGTTWVLDTLITGDTASNSAVMEGAFLEFSDDGTLVGSTGCRRLEGEWSLQGATIQIPILSAIDDPTAGVCSPESEALDGDIIAVVESGTTVEVEGDRLTMTAPGGDGLSFTASDSQGS
jgi:heat shock protein HslJ